MPAAMVLAYRLAKATGTWPWVRELRLRWLAWARRQMPITDLRQQELLLERYALERLP